MTPEIPLQDSKDSVKLIRPRYPEGKDRGAECASFPKKYEKCGLRAYKEITTHLGAAEIGDYFLMGPKKSLETKPQRRIR